MNSGSDDLRELLVRHLMVIPKNMQERCWLVDAVRKAKETASREMDDAEKYETRGFLDVLESDPFAFADESSSFTGFDAAKEELLSWVGIEFELFISLGFENCFSAEERERLSSQIARETTPIESSILKKMLDNNINLVVNGEELLKDAKERLEETNEEWERLEKTDKSGFDDEEWFELDEIQDAREAATELITILPLAWTALKELTKVPGIAAYVAPNHLFLIQKDECSRFVEKYKEQVIDSSNKSSTTWDDLEDDIPF